MSGGAAICQVFLLRRDGSRYNPRTMRNQHFRGAATGLLLLCLCFPALADEPQITVATGFDRRVKGNYVPVRLRIDTNTEGFAGEVRVQYRLQQSNARLVRRLDVPPQSKTAVRLCIPIDSPTRWTDLVLRRDDGRETVLPLECRLLVGTRFWVVITDTAGGLETTASPLPTPAGETAPAGAAPTVDVAYLDAAGAPGHWQAYSGVDALILHLPEPGRFDPDQVTAIRRFVELGGHLVVSLGTRPTALRGTWLEDLLPGTVEGIAELDSLADLERAAGVPPTAPGRFGVARLQPLPEARIRAHQGGTALVCSIARAGGQVTVLAFDYQAAPFKGHAGVDRLLADLHGSIAATVWDETQIQLSHLVPPLVAGRHALDWRLAAWLLGVLLVYVVALPVVQRRCFGGPVTPHRVVTTMLGFPLAAALVVGLLLAWMPGPPLGTHSVGVLFLPPGAAAGASHQFRVLQSPRAETTDIGFPEPDVMIDAECGSAMELVLAGGYRFRSEGTVTVEGVRLLPSVPRTFLTTSRGALAGPLRVTAIQEGEGWKVGVDNATGCDLEDLRVAVPGREALLGDLAAGASLPLRWAEFQVLARTPPPSPWAPSHQDLRDAVRGEICSAFDLYHTGPAGEAVTSPVHITGWVALPADATLAGVRPTEWTNETLLVQVQDGEDRR